MSRVPKYGQDRRLPPLDLSSPLKIDPAFARDKTIVITGGASGFGAGFCTNWAPHGANIIIGDVNITAGEALIANLRLETNNQNLHFIHLDVTSWRSQVDFFREAVRLSPHGGIDTVIANAGVNGAQEAAIFENPVIDYLNDPNPPAPTFTTLDVNLTGVLYTVHLALFYLPRNPGSTPCSPTSPARPGQRDRHLILLGSIASLYPVITQTPYTASKHAVLGIFRSLRMNAPLTSGIRVNMLCPYFIHTPILSTTARLLLAGNAVGCVEDVVEAATCLVSRPDIIGRALVIGPKVKVRVQVDEDGIGLGGTDGIPYVEQVVEVVDPKRGGIPDGQSAIQERAIWEVYADDFQHADPFTARMMNIISAASAVKGWVGFAVDIASTIASRLWYGKPNRQVTP
jgi:NAD(P)-dependent dehydrogenase (short-subunit alcohol dehydrogenase family)